MIHFVGAGSGAPDLITVRGKKYLDEADVVIYAGSLVNPKLLEYTKDICTIYNSAKMTLEEADTALQASVRENDVWRISEKGELFLILSQTDRSSLPIIFARLENDGFGCHEIDTVENANTGEKL